jgi:hypothetical protein
LSALQYARMAKYSGVSIVIVFDVFIPIDRVLQ